MLCDACSNPVEEPSNRELQCEAVWPACLDIFVTMVHTTLSSPQYQVASDAEEMIMCVKELFKVLDLQGKHTVKLVHMGTCSLLAGSLMG